MQSNISVQTEPPKPGTVIDDWSFPMPFIVLKIEDGRIYGVPYYGPPTTILKEWDKEEYRKIGEINSIELEKYKTRYGIS